MRAFEIGIARCRGGRQTNAPSTFRFIHPQEGSTMSTPDVIASLILIASVLKIEYTITTIVRSFNRKVSS